MPVYTVSASIEPDKCVNRVGVFCADTFLHVCLDLVARMSVENIMENREVLGGNSRGHVKAIVAIFASIGLGMGITVFLIGQEAGGVAQMTIGGLMLWLLPFIGPALAAILGALSGATNPAGVRGTVLAPAVGALVGYILMFMLIMPFLMAQPTQGALPPEQLAMFSMRSLPGTVLAGAIGAYVGAEFES